MRAQFDLMLARSGQQAIVTVRGPASSTKDRYHTPVLTVATETMTYDCLLRQEDSREIPIGTDVVVSNLRLYLPKEALVNAASQVEVQGVMAGKYQVIGTPAPVVGVRQEILGIAAHVRAA